MDLGCMSHRRAHLLIQLKVRQRQLHRLAHLLLLRVHAPDVRVLQTYTHVNKSGAIGTRTSARPSHIAACDTATAWHERHGITRCIATVAMHACATLAPSSCTLPATDRHVRLLVGREDGDGAVRLGRQDVNQRIRVLRASVRERQRQGECVSAWERVCA